MDADFHLHMRAAFLSSLLLIVFYLQNGTTTGPKTAEESIRTWTIQRFHLFTVPNQRWQEIKHVSFTGSLITLQNGRTKEHSSSPREIPAHSLKYKATLFDYKENTIPQQRYGIYAKLERKFFKRHLANYTNWSASFNPSTLVLMQSGDVHPQPGPNQQSIKCQECSRTIVRNHWAVLCDTFSNIYHIKCGQVAVSEYNKWKSNTNTKWICPLCLINTLLFTLDNSLNSTQENNLSMTNNSHDNNYDDPLEEMSSIRQKYHAQDLIFHYNINSLQKKFEEIKLINEKLKATIIVLTETKINSSHHNNQFAMMNYCIFQRKTKKE